MQSTYQSRLGATECAVIFSMEPVWTVGLAVSGWVPGIREHLSVQQALGGVLILSATLVAELGPRLARRRDTPEPEEVIG